METHLQPVKIRKLNIGDLPFCQNLVMQAGWNQTETDWLRALALEPEGCFAGEIAGQPVATTTTCRFDTCGWIAMVLVDPAYRKRGIARQMLEYAINYLENMKVKTIRLDATALGRPLYQQLGFADEYEVVRYRREGSLRPDLGCKSGVTTVETLKKIISLDKLATYTQRGDFLRALIENAGENGCATHFGLHGELTAFATCRVGLNAVQIGPCIARNSSSANAVLNNLLAGFEGINLFVDVPASNPGAVRWAEESGFVPQRTFVRMYRGEPVQDFPNLIWASAGPEKG